MDENELLKKLSELKPPIIINDLKDLYIETDMFMKKNKDVWEFYYCERGNQYLKCIFYTEEDALEYFFCCCKNASDNRRWF